MNEVPPEVVVDVEEELVGAHVVFAGCRCGSYIGPAAASRARCVKVVLDELLVNM